MLVQQMALVICAISDFMALDDRARLSARERLREDR